MSRKMLEEQRRAMEVMEQLEYTNEMFGRARKLCWQKCIANFGESDLTPGESECVERCVLKFLEVQNVVGARMATTQGAMAALQKEQGKN